MHAINSPGFRRAVAALQSGSTRKRISKKNLLTIQLPVAPALEQSRIADGVDSYFTRLDDAVASLKRVQANLKRYRASVLKAAVEGRLVPTEAELARKEGRDYEPASVLLDRILAERRKRWEEAELAKLKANGKAPTDDRWKRKYKEPVAPDSDGLPGLPKGWCWASVEAISTKVVDGVHKKPDYVEEGIPFVTVRNLTAGPEITLAGARYVTEEDHRRFTQRADPEKGDLLISKDGTLGVVRAIRTDAVFSIFVSVALVKSINRELTDYLEIGLSSPSVQAQMVPKGSGLQHIHLEDLRQDCVPLPPLAEQARIVTAVRQHLSLIERLEGEIENRVISRCHRLRGAVLKRAFEGKLVAQNPNDEPASVLLDRIRAERAATKPEAKSRNRRAKVKAT
jgi:type I restriction enzyme S subunit